MTIRGWQRAGAWAALFGAGLGSDYPRPGAIYAAKPERGGEDDHEPSQRPYETIVPLAARLRIDPVIDLAKEQTTGLASRLGKETGVVLVSWEHKAIVEGLLPALLDGQQIKGVPKKWDPERFDVVLRFDRALPGAPWSFRQLFPRLLSGDSDAPLKSES